MRDLVNRMLAAAVDGPDPVRRRLGGPGWSWPSLGSLRVEDHGRGNLVLTAGRPDEIVPEFGPRAESNLIVYEGARAGTTRVFVHGSHNAAVLRTTGTLNLRITIAEDGHLVFWGKDATSNSGHILLGQGGRGTSVLVGEDCMFSHQIEVRAADSHAIVDVATLERINPPASVVLGPHTWLGHGCKVLGGVEIGAGSVVGAGAVVTRGLPPMSTSVGVPARTVREGVTWTRHADPSPRHVEIVMAALRACGALASTAAG